MAGCEFRTRERVRHDRPRFKADEKERARLVRQFAAASAAADEEALLSLFSDDIVMTADGGGKVHAARRPVYGRERLARLFSITTRKYGGVLEHFLAEVNGETALVTFADGEVFGVNTVAVENGKITALYRVMNPEKLRAFGDDVIKGERVMG